MHFMQLPLQLLLHAYTHIGIMIEILDEYLNLVYPDMGVKIGSKYISGKYILH